MTTKKLGPSAADIQNHLYTSFLEGSTADVALRVHGTWDAIYKLHRVVLIQSGFFRSLFTAGFAESTPRIGSCTGIEEIVIHFDDPNITRAAFEVCISRLYGGGPTLDIDPSMIPTFSQPLTPSFPYEPQPHKTPSGHHPATPRFLLSLLATAVYLSIPSLASQALSSILSTVGPRTVLKYLDFATGVHIGHFDRESGEPEAAVGLESVAVLIEYEESISDAVSIEADSSDHDHIKKKDAASSKTLTSSIALGASEEFETKDTVKQPSCHYGAISDRIGEACTCWLAKWGVDIFQFEERQESSADRKENSMHLTRKRSKSAPSGSIRATGAKEQQYCVPLIWSRGGLTARWAAAIISADTFFIRGERERYDFARRVVELRRKRGIIASEEEEWNKLFDHGIYYSNMNMDDLIFISRDISTTTNQPFVPLTTIQASLWTQSVLRHHITVRPGFPRSQSGSTPSPSLRDKELGITRTTGGILKESGTLANESKFYFPVTGNFSVRIGDTGSDFSGTQDGKSPSMDQFFSSPSTSTLSPLPSSPTLEPTTVSVAKSVLTTEAECFGLRPSIYTASSAHASDPKGESRWSPYPPCRFAVEFWGLDSLNEKSRLYSHTISYAGSMFNTYLQIARKKGQIQLGIYLHRQSNIEPVPPSSVPASSRYLRNDANNFSSTLDRTSSSLPTTSSPPTQDISHQSPSTNLSSRSMTPSSGVPSTPLSGSTSSSLSSSFSTPFSSTTVCPPVAPSQQYRDPRSLISAYFMITCASKTGSSQIRFASAPDVFSVGQSWGWKSSSMTEEYIGGRSEKGTTPSDALQSKYSSLRATVVLGLV